MWGYEDGLKEGRQEGLKEGLLLGRLEIATQLVASGIDIERVARYLSLEESEIRDFSARKEE